MSKRTISMLIKVMIVLLAVTGAVCLLMMRRILDYLLPGFSGMTHRFWLYSIYVCAVPCFAALAPAWMISGNIGKNLSFSLSSARNMRYIGWLMGFDTAAVLLMNVILFILGRSFFAFFIAVFLIVAGFFAAAVCAFSLSSLLYNAAELQEQADGTI